jgi:hypothetical protein
MRKLFLSISSVIAMLGLGVLAFAASGTEYAGTWKGNWAGEGGAGRFDMTITTEADGKVSGGVSVGADTGDYTAKFVSVAITGNKLTARYSYPPEEQLDIAVTATFENGKATGTWSMVPKGQDTAMASGTLNVEKK